VFHLAGKEMTAGAPPAPTRPDSQSRGTITIDVARLTGRTSREGTAIIPDEAEFAVEDEPLLTARRCAEDLGGTDPVAPATGAVLRFLALAIGARSVVEIGTGCGSSGIWLLRGMRLGGVLTSVDTEPEYHRVARKAFGQAGFAANQARLIVGRALDVLPRLSDGAYDMVFADADQGSYPEYLTAGLRLLRSGGVIVFDDAWPGSIASGSVVGSSVAGGSVAGGAAVAGRGAFGPGDPGGAAAGVGGVGATGLAAAAGVRELAEMVRIDERLVPLRLAVAGGLIAAIKR
jgi:predicted O-methyltransferase YrrM